MKPGVVSFFIIFSFIHSCIAANAQVRIPIGTWRSHTSFVRANAVQCIEENYYVGTDGGLFIYDPSENSFEKFTTVEGLSDLKIQSMAYLPTWRILLLGYASGRMDALNISKKTIRTIPYLYQFNSLRDKAIRKMISVNNDVWMLTDVGILVFNPQRYEIRATYSNIGPNAAAITPIDLSFYNDTVFVAINDAVLTASVGNNRNLMDFRNWQALPMPVGIRNFQAIVRHASEGLIGIAGTAGLYRYHAGAPGGWELLTTFSGNCTFARAVADSILIGATDGVYVLKQGQLQRVNGINISSPTDMCYSENGSTLAFTTLYNALNLYGQNTAPYSVVANGPHSNFAFNIDVVDRSIWVMSGGYDRNTTQNFSNNGFYIFDNATGSWQTLIPGFFNNLPTFDDPVRATYNPYLNETYLASVGYGLMIARQNFQNITIIDDKTDGCPLTNLLPQATFSKYVRVPDIYFDKTKGQLWLTNIINDANRPAVFRFDPYTRTCEGFRLPTEGAKKAIGVVTDRKGNVWVRCSFTAGGGIIAFDPTRTFAQVPFFKEWRKGKGEGNLVSNVVTCMAMDKDDHLWIGTDYGISVIYNASMALDATNADAGYPIVNNWPLLFEQVVNCIAIDGGNKKWIGTNSGLYLFSEDGTRVLHFFNMENSPLPSDKVLSVNVHPLTGEVFIGTDKGVISYREGTTDAALAYSGDAEIKIFPNPVPKGFTGTIGISNLMADAEVKITDINGNLVYKTMASGGTALWNGRDYSGKNIAPGVYVVVAADRTGSMVKFGKIFMPEP